LRAAITKSFQMYLILVMLCLLKYTNMNIARENTFYISPFLLLMAWMSLP